MATPLTPILQAPFASPLHDELQQQIREQRLLDLAD
jgi:hypothetical protein